VLKLMGIDRTTSFTLLSETDVKRHFPELEIKKKS